MSTSCIKGNNDEVHHDSVCSLGCLNVAYYLSILHLRFIMPVFTSYAIFLIQERFSNEYVKIWKILAGVKILIESRSSGPRR